MPYEINATHDASLESWVESANDPASDFPIQNLPLCDGFVRDDDEDEPGPGVAIGDRWLSLERLALMTPFLDEFFPEGDADRDGIGGYCVAGEFGAFSPAQSTRLRAALVTLLGKDCASLRDDAELVEQVVLPMSAIELVLPCSQWGTHDYTDFYASLEHATNVGSMFRPDNPLLPNYKHMPIAYHGRASSLVVSGQSVWRPVGQLLPGATIADGPPVLGACKLLDYELEVGLIVGRGNELGEAISIGTAEEHILGLCLVNDWSARDMQKWEYQPLGPFLAKNFATSVSPFVVTLDALAPFRCAAKARSADDPKLLDYLVDSDNQKLGGFDITLEVHLASAQMRQQEIAPIRLSRGNFKEMYWTIAQMLAHHTVGGCNLQAGDLLASGTVSGRTREARGSLLELTWDGDPWGDPPSIVPGSQRTPIELPTGETRKFLADGDEVTITGYCEREGFRRIGMGSCSGVIEPAREVS